MYCLEWQVLNLSYFLPLIINLSKSIKEMKAFTGKLPRINLNTSTYRKEEIPDRHYKEFISARGLSVKYLYDELKANLDPLDPENKLLLSIGILGGTGLQGFSKWCVASKSPLTSTVFRAITGGNFGAWMKFDEFAKSQHRCHCERPARHLPAISCASGAGRRVRVRKARRAGAKQSPSMQALEFMRLFRRSAPRNDR